MKSGMSKDNQLIIAEQQEKEKAYWLNRLSGELVKSFFPYDLDHRESCGEERTAAVVPFEWGGALPGGIWAQGGGSPYKIHIIVLAGISLLLDKYTGNGDIIVITPVYRPDIEEDFINVVLPVRTQPGTQKTFRELLKLVSKTVVEASAHQNYPMNVLSEQIGMPLIQGEPSLFETALVIENIHDPKHIRTMNPGVIFSLRVKEDSINGTVEYPANLYERTTIERIIEHLARLLGEAVRNPDRPLTQLEILSEQEKKQLSVEEGRFLYRGCWVQPEKLEKYLLKLVPLLNDVVVTVQKDEYQGETLRAYFVSERDLSPSEVKERLRGKLPGYLMPVYLARIDTIPLTPAGQKDRNPFTLRESETRAKARFAVPADSTEEKLGNIWSEVLEMESEDIPVDMDFAQFGGQSLKAIMMSSKIHKVFNISIPIPTIFQLSTIRDLGRYIKDTIKTEFCPIDPVEKRDYYELSPGQKRLYLLQQLELGSISYNVPQMVILEGELHRERLETAFTQIIRRHESLRTSFRVVEDRPVQEIHDLVEFAVEYHEPGHEKNKHDRPDRGVSREIGENFVKPFDLTQAPLLRVGLVKESNARHILMVDRHHIISDATSRGLFLKDIVRLYEGKELLPLRLQYKDYSQWQNSPKQKQEIKEQENYWLRQFGPGEEIPVLNLTLDYPRPVVQRFEGKDFGFSLGEEETQKIQQLAAGEGATLFMVLLAIYNVFLSKICHQEDIIVGTPVLGRRHDDLKDILGIFVNTLALRNFPVSGKSFKEFLKDLKTNALSAFENQVYPFEELVDRVVINRDISRNPLFDTVFMLQEPGGPDMEPGELKVLPYEYHSTTAKFDLLLSGVKENRILSFVFEYGTRLFTEPTIRRYAGFFKKIIAGVLENSDKKISGIEIISEEEKERLLMEFNRTGTDYPRERTIHELFLEQAGQTPDCLALLGLSNLSNRSDLSDQPKQSDLSNRSDSSDRSYISITYKELNERSGQLAGMLMERGVKPDTIVGMMAERSVEMVIGVLGILKAGGGYLPIDPGYPPERIEYMLADSGVNVLVSDRNDVGTGHGTGNWPVPILDLIHAAGQNNRTHTTTTCPVGPANLAYVIYTSGTTGKPKAVMVQHINVVRLVKNTDFVEFSPGDRVLQTGALEFDASTFEIWGSMLNGLELTLVRNQVILSPEKLKETLRKRGITTMWLTVSLFNQLSDEEIEIFGGLKNLLVGGDILSPPHINRLRNRYPRLKVINGYGPTENTTFSTTYLIDKEHTRNIPIGKPIANSTAYIVDGFYHVLPVGIPGELLVGGDGIARGYLNNPGLTAERFCLRRPEGALFEKTAPPGPPRKNFSLNPAMQQKVPGKNHGNSPLTIHHSPLYQTGDLARWHTDGNIEFMGRKDHQVKIRGFRVELGEIENRLLKYPGVKEVVVSIKTGESGDKYLGAYVVGVRREKDGGAVEIEAEKLREFLTQRLPDYMIPAYFMQVEKIPLTPNGKVDRGALPEPDIEVGGKYVAPRDRIENEMVEIWSQVLGVEKQVIGIDSNFFALGGHSLKATLLVNRVHKKLEVQVPLTEVFTSPTIRELTRYIKGAEKAKFAAIEPVEKRDYYALSAAQKRLYLIQQMDISGTAYNINEVVPLGEEWEVKKLELIFKTLIQRHDSLRTGIHLVEEEPVQRVHETVEFEIEVFGGVQGNLFSKRFPWPPEAIIRNFIRPFDLSKPPLLRVGLIRLPSKDLLVMDIHHIISDGASMDLLKKEFQGLAVGEDLPFLRLRYKDYSAWQNRLLESEVMNKPGNHWLRNFQGEIPVSMLPYDYPRPLTQSFEGAALAFEINETQTQRLKAITRQAGATVYMGLLSLYMIWLSKLSGQEDIIVGTPVAGRRHADLERIVGMFVNTLPIRRQPEGEKTFTEFLDEVKEHTLDAFDNQEYQFEALVEKTAVRRDTGRNPIFDVMFSLLNPSPAAGSPHNREFEEIETSSSSIEHRPGNAKFDLTLTAVDRGEGQGKKFFFNLQYCIRLFKPQTIERWIGYFKKIIATVVECPQEKISRIDLLSPAEKHRVLVEFNRTAAPYPQDKTIPGLFAGQVERTPDRVALLGLSYLSDQSDSSGQPKQSNLSNRSDSSDQSYISITYKELNERSGRLAGILIERGVKLDTIVGIMAERSVEMVIGVLGILEAGGAYLPIDPGYPPERIEYMLADSGVKILVTDRNDVGTGHCPVPILDLIHATGQNNRTHTTTTCPVGSANLAYVIYTSGTTGKPKAVMVQHINVVRLVKNTNFVEFSPGDRILQTGALEFDASTFEIWGSMLNGLELTLVRNQVILSPEKLKETLRKRGITTMWLTVSLFNQLLDEEIEIFGGLKNLLVGGDILSPPHINRLRNRYPRLNVINGYGPTENTTFSTTYLIDKEHTRNIPIGKPIANSTAYIVDGFYHLLPVGIPGELLVGGDGVSRGYLNRPGLTAERFIGLDFYRSHRSYTIYKKIYYRTGDLARWHADGNIEFLGRKDHQVKIRGFRIELGEIENRLLKYPGVKEVVVSIKTGESGDKYLGAYVVGVRREKDGGAVEIEAEKLREFLTQRLPDYMIPAYFMQMEKIPLTPNGKVDRKALPEPDIKVEGNYIAPRDKIENEMVEIWSQVLGVEKRVIGIDSNFFELGGHSLKAAVLTAKIRKEYRVMIPLADLFNRPYIKSLAEIIRNAGARGEKGTAPTAGEHFELLRKGNPNAANLFFIHDGSGEVDGYIEFCSRLSDEFNCWGIRAEKIENYTPRNLTIRDIAQRYIEEIKAFQVHGPYYLAGWSIGGTIAFEIARRMEQSRDEVGFLALIDTLPPDKSRSEQGREFDRETEMQIIRSYSRDEEIKTIYENAGEIDFNEIWPRLLGYVEEKSNEFDIQEVKDSVPGNLAQIIPNFTRLGIKELVYYLNMVRTYDYARNIYIPGGKIQTGLHFFKAGKAASPISAEEWNSYCRDPIRIYEIPGDHVSVLEMPNVESFAELFLKVIRDVLKRKT